VGLRAYLPDLGLKSQSPEGPGMPRIIESAEPPHFAAFKELLTKDGLVLSMKGESTASATQKDIPENAATRETFTKGTAGDAQTF